MKGRPQKRKKRKNSSSRAHGLCSRQAWFGWLDENNITIKKQKFIHDVNDDGSEIAKSYKSDYPPSHCLNVNVMLSNITFL